MELNKTLYISPLMVMTDKEYTKHYFIEGERVCTKVGGGFRYASTDPDAVVLPFIKFSAGEVADDLETMLIDGVNCSGYPSNLVSISKRLRPAKRDISRRERQQYFYHPDHLGSSSFITNAIGYAEQHLQYLPFGESFIDQRIKYSSRYTFSAKEKDDETQYSYFGARYYDSDLSIFLSVDNFAEKYPYLSPYHYCENNPINMIDINGDTTIYYHNGEYLFTSYDNTDRLVCDLSDVDPDKAEAFKNTLRNAQADGSFDQYQDDEAFNDELRAMGTLYDLNSIEAFFNDNNEDYFNKAENDKNEHGSFMVMRGGKMVVADVNLRGSYNTVEWWEEMSGGNPSKDVNTGKSARELGFGVMDPNIHTHPNSSNPPSPGSDWKDYSTQKRSFDVMVNKTQIWFYNKKNSKPFHLEKNNIFSR